MLCRCATLQLGVQQHCRSRLQQRALEAALAGGSARGQPQSVSIPGSRASCQHRSCSLCFCARCGTTRRERGCLHHPIEFGMQRILQRTSIHKFPFLWAEEQTKVSSRSDKALVALAGKRTSEVYTQALARATPTTTAIHAARMQN